MLYVKPLRVIVREAYDPIFLFLENRTSSHFSKDVCFYRVIGADCSDDEFVAGILDIDKRAVGMRYLRLGSLPLVPTDTDKYAKCFDGWRLLDQSAREALFSYKLPFTFSNDNTMELTLKLAYQKALEVYTSETSNLTDSMLKNFSVKMLYWIDCLLPMLFRDSAVIVTQFPKLLYTGKIKKQESLFLYFLSLLGCDILYINSETDIPLDYQTVIDNSRLKQSGELRVCNLPIPDYQAAVSVSVALPTETKATVLVAEPLQTIQPSRNPLSITPKRQKDNRDNPGRELSFEEIAALSEAIVMIKVIDESGEYFKTGSGVVISPDGYILTNCHVVSGGEGFAVKFENDSKEYFTRSLVKYHTDYDLAVIRVDRTCQILPVLAQGSLVRGQRIAAIGSPLGLFNTISDGIISGFRELELKSMIQFTAPISHGSSGGALIDLYGRLVGIITAGFDDGQNLNLAVDYTTINTFANNFIRR